MHLRLGRVPHHLPRLLPPPRNPGSPGFRTKLRKSGKPDLRWGRGGEGGGHRLRARRYPPPCPSPSRGEGTLLRRPLNSLMPAFAVTSLWVREILHAASFPPV